MTKQDSPGFSLYIFGLVRANYIVDINREEQSRGAVGGRAAPSLALKKLAACSPWARSAAKTHKPHYSVLKWQLGGGGGLNNHTTLNRSLRVNVTERLKYIFALR